MLLDTNQIAAIVSNADCNEYAVCDQIAEAQLAYCEPLIRRQVAQEIKAWVEDHYWDTLDTGILHKHLQGLWKQYGVQE